MNRLLQLEPNNERAFFNLGMLAMDDDDMTSAEHNFKVPVLAALALPFPLTFISRFSVGFHSVEA